MIFSALLGIAGGLHFASSLDTSAAFENLSLSRSLLVVWLPLIFIPISAVQFIGVPPGKNNDASAIVNLARNLGGSFGVSIATTQLQWRSQFHTERLGEHVTAYNGYGFGQSLQAISAAIQSQAQMLSYIDVFTILSFVALAVAPLALFLPKLPKGAGAGAH